MSLAPGALEEYDGSGDWFKIATVGSTDGQYWDTDLDRTGVSHSLENCHYRSIHTRA